MVGSLYRTSKYFKSRSGPKQSTPAMWSEAAHPLLSTLNRVQKCPHILVGNKLFSILQTLSHRQDAVSLSLFYRYSRDQLANKPNFLLRESQELSYKNRTL